MNTTQPDFKHPEPCDPSQKFENALIDLRRATDSRGLRIMLAPSCYSAESFRERIRRFADDWFKFDKIEYFDAPNSESGEITFARNLSLLTAAYLAALEYERSAKPSC